MKKILFLILAMFTIAACEKSEDNLLKCGGYEVLIEITEKALIATINGDVIDMELVTSDTGVRYAGVLNDTNVGLYNLENKWTLFLNDEPSIECD